MSKFEAKPWVQWFGATPDHKPDYVEMVEQEVRQLMESRGLSKDDKNIEHALACAYMRGIDSVDMYLRNSLSAYRNSARGPQWISVKERLPEIGDHGYSEDVLLLTQVGRMEVSHIEKVKRVVKWRGIEPVIETENGTPIEDFTHWMPLPKPPEDK